MNNTETTLTFTDSKKELELKILRSNMDDNDKIDAIRSIENSYIVYNDNIIYNQPCRPQEVWYGSGNDIYTMKGCSNVTSIGYATTATTKNDDEQFMEQATKLKK